MSSFVVIYDRRTGKSEVRPHHGPQAHREAFRERLALEAQNHNPDVEIVSLISDSLETIKRTHSRYFQTA